jgi:hypothetical protein
VCAIQLTLLVMYCLCRILIAEIRKTVIVEIRQRR